jgi:hypothetical protein
LQKFYGIKIEIERAFAPPCQLNKAIAYNNYKLLKLKPRAPQVKVERVGEVVVDANGVGKAHRAEELGEGYAVVGADASC